MMVAITCCHKTQVTSQALAMTAHLELRQVKHLPLQGHRITVLQETPKASG